jgi:hypothetical protein
MRAWWCWRGPLGRFRAGASRRPSRPRARPASCRCTSG